MLENTSSAMCLPVCYGFGLVLERCTYFFLKISEMLALLPGVKYIERTSLHSPQEIIKTKKAIKQAFLNQVDKVGFSLIEVLSPCPTYWGLLANQSLNWIRDTMAKEFPLGRIK